MSLLALLPLLATPALAHLALYHPSMYGFEPNNPWAWEQNIPLDGRSFNDWWFHGDINEPPEDGVFMELPAGSSVMLEIACDKAQTSYGGPMRDNPNHQLPLMACGSPREGTFDMGAIHATDLFPGPGYGNSKSVKGSALAIAYESDVTKIKPEDFVVISVNHTSPWVRETYFAIPAGLPECPPGGCHCAWGWIPDVMNVQQMYLLGYKCKVIGDLGTEMLAKPQIARKCPYDKNNCTMGAKQLHYVNQAEGNNNHQARMDNPYYNYDYGFHDGAQTDVWSLDDGATWNNDELAPESWQSLTSVSWAPNMTPTWTITPDSRGPPPTGAAGGNAAAAAATTTAAAAGGAAAATVTGSATVAPVAGSKTVATPAATGAEREPAAATTAAAGAFASYIADYGTADSSWHSRRRAARRAADSAKKAQRRSRRRV